ncbi:MAG: GNAT family N-acetyltransferase, partial [Planctomycetota bacterium]
MELIRIGRGGRLPKPIEPSDHLKMVLEMTEANYQRVGFEEPWVGYVAFDDLRPIGVCGFKSAPKDGRVEIAYHTLPGLEGSGIATSMASKLIEIAESVSNVPTVFAQTLPEESA